MDLRPKRSGIIALWRLRRRRRGCRHCLRQSRGRSESERYQESHVERVRTLGKNVSRPIFRLTGLPI